MVTKPSGGSLEQRGEGGRRGGAYGAASPVATGTPGAFVDLDLAAGAREAGPAGAGVAALARVAASGSVQAGLVVGAVVEVWTDTAAHVGDVLHSSSSSTSAAAPSSRLLIRPGGQLLPQTFRPGATVGAVGVGGHPEVLLLLLTLVAEEPPPALLAVALPGLLAGPVQAARVADALVAVAALESHPAPVVQGGRDSGQSCGAGAHEGAGPGGGGATHLHSPGLSQKPCSSSQPGRQMAAEANTRSESFHCSLLRRLSA